MPSLADFWWFVLMACLAWYSTMTVYVAVRGASDIKHMLARLERSDVPDEESSD